MESGPDERYFPRLAAAFVRGRLGAVGTAGICEVDLLKRGADAGLRLHKFKQNAELPRVKRVLGMLRAIQPASLIDIGSGRGTFLWPLLNEFPALPVVAVDLSWQRVSDIAAVRRGGVENLSAIQADVERLPLAERSADVVTALEVLEHLRDPQAAMNRIADAAARFVIVSAPSKPDENPEHIQLFTDRSLRELMERAGLVGVQVSGVLNHFVAMGRKGRP